jgi:hypothetical protein
VLNARKPSIKISIMKTRLFIYMLLVSIISCRQAESQNQSSADYKVTDLTLKDIPESIIVNGKLLLAKKWNDKNGENLLIVSRKGPIKETEYKIEFSGNERYAELYGEQYIKKGDTYALLWDIHDFERHCHLDLWIGLLPNSTMITDLDNDGISETTLIYKLSCRGDVSPSRMKLLIHENNVKMGLRGTMMIKPKSDKLDSDFEHDLSKVDTVGLSELEKILALYGRYENEKDFKDQPHEFLKFAKEQWLKYIDKDEYLQF